MKVAERSIKTIKPYERNPRSKNGDAIDAVAKSIEAFGFRQPIVVDDAGVIIVGHTRYEAAQKLGLAKVPVHVATGLSAEQIKAYRIADNRTGELSDWEAELLALELGELDEAEFDLDLLAFGDGLPEAMGKSEEPIVEDQIPEPPENPITQPGDVWQMGKHRLICGDATNPDDVSALLDGATPFMMVTDPPYGVDYDPEWRDVFSVGQNRRRGKVTNDDRDDWTEAYELSGCSLLYVWFAPTHSAAFQTSIERAGYLIRSQLAWAKNNFPISRGHYHWRHELCWYAVRKGDAAKWKGGRKQSTLWNDIELSEPDTGVEGGHSTQKPLECMARPIRNHGDAGDAVYDPFCGSGTTVIACEQLGRQCFAMEIAPAYCDVIVQRWERFTGQTATRTPADTSTSTPATKPKRNGKRAAR